MTGDGLVKHVFIFTPTSFWFSEYYMQAVMHLYHLHTSFHMCVFHICAVLLGQLISDDITEVISRYNKEFFTPYGNQLTTKSAGAQYDDSYLGKHL